MSRVCGTCAGDGVVDGKPCPVCFPRAQSGQRDGTPKTVSVPTSVREVKARLRKARVTTVRTPDGVRTTDRLTGTETVGLTAAQKRELARRAGVPAKRKKGGTR